MVFCEYHNQNRPCRDQNSADIIVAAEIIMNRAAEYRFSFAFTYRLLAYFSEGSGPAKLVRDFLIH
jgi:hypothetical protein